LPSKKLTAAACAAAMLATASPAMAKELRVDDNGAECPSAQFTSIQAAVTAAAPGDKIKVCAGTYDEQVNIQSKSRLKLESVTPQAAVIRFPAANTQPNNTLVRITRSDDVDVRGFTITGPYSGVGCSAEPHRGVYVDNSLRANLANNAITDIRDADPALRGCQEGIAVQVGRNADGSVGTGDVTQNAILRYQKGGVVVDGSGSGADVDHNTIDAQSGGEPQPYAAPNGIQISRGATGQADHNDVTGNVFTGDKTIAGGTGIILFQLDGGVRVDHNTTHDNDDNLSLSSADNLRIEENTSLNALFYDGLFADSDSTGNLFKGNQADNNAEHDCHDDSHGTGTAGTGNTWKDDRGDTQTPQGICRPNQP